MFAAKRHPAKSITLTITPLLNTIDIEHDFSGFTSDIPLRCDGEQQFWLKYNFADNKHYGIVGIAENTLCELDFTDDKGDLRTASSTSLTAPVRPTPGVGRVRYVSPDTPLLSGNDYSAGSPGNLEEALGGVEEQANDYIILYEGTKPYDLTTDVQIQGVAVNVVLIAEAGETPVISGARKTAITWFDETGGIYSTTDYDPNCRQVHAVISSTVERFVNYSTLAELQSADHGWCVETGKLYVKLSSDPLSTVTVDPSFTTVLLGDTNKEILVVFGDGFWCEGIVFEHTGAGTGTTSRALRISADNVTVKDCIFRHVYSQGLMLSSCNDVHVDNCSFIEHNDYLTFNDIKSGPKITEPASQLLITSCARVTVKGSTFYGTMDLIRVELSNNINVYDSTFTKGRGESLDFDTDLVQVKRWGNVVDQCFNLIGLATFFKGPLWIINDKCYKGGYLGPIDENLAILGTEFASGNSATKFNSATTGTIGQLLLLNNTLDATFGIKDYYPDARAWIVDGGAGNNDFPQGDTYMRNNILVTFGRPFEDQNVDGSYDINHNLYWTTNTYSYPTMYHWRFGVSASSFVDFQTVSGQEINGEETDPILILGVPQTPIPGQVIPGITGNAIFGTLEPVKGAQ